ncbi:hypothetical protein BCV69DRAFT_267900 [Microstroma glucosiphilum]|uniref:N-acetyltransferase domain-containing protein n=1 Tax=Pseudomicrostroma glucosiphilum TaxID=1684307 RepID=A0A316UB87_9BASI|nr:hypothetical protein BCV69DRAFT_267900 [Pseudomicrostroma glucosiphilum]PWN22490.1 hypothetical protein BCV69DRAFT_267900 [Pseudomicrostroma glucosiphilum]
MEEAWVVVVRWAWLAAAVPDQSVVGGRSANAAAQRGPCSQGRDTSYFLPSLRSSTPTPLTQPAMAATTSTLPPTSFGTRPAAALKGNTARRIELTNLTPNNIGQLRKLNSVLLPVRYSEAFYKDTLSEERRDICKLALFNDMPVGMLVCRFEYPDPPQASSSSSSPAPVKVYIMTLGVLAPYRRLGIASKMIKHLLTFAGPGTELDLPDPALPAPLSKAIAAGSAAKKDTATAGKKDNKEEKKTKKYLVESVYLHVQTTNDEAKDFYKKQGFGEGEVLEEYYRRGVEPRSAVILERK